jgi:uncharacterized protein YndB with AHSA1/START domain
LTTDDVPEGPGLPEGPGVTDDKPEAAVVVQRVLPAPPDVVFDEWLDPVGMAEWMCPRPSRPTQIDLDPRVGGRFLIEIDDEGFELSVTGEYLELDRPHRIRFTWDCSVWEPSDTTSVVTVTLEPDGDGCTLMTIHHVQLPPKVVDGHRHGWALIGQQLEDSLNIRS